MSIFETAIGWIAPPECINCGLEGSALCIDCSDSKIVPFGERCWRCNSLSPNYRTCPKCRHIGSPSHVWISSNYEDLARELIKAYKFGYHRAAAESIARRMVSTLGVPMKHYLIVPVPTATRRIRQRGFDHSELLARKIALYLRLDQTNNLRRLGQTRQLGSRREDRLKQLSSSLVVKNPRAIAGRDVLLIDDVITTGGTIIAATHAIKTAGAKSVDALLFAKRL